jgi:hypothetical protein
MPKRGSARAGSSTTKVEIRVIDPCAVVWEGRRVTPEKRATEPFIAGGGGGVARIDSGVGLALRRSPLRARPRGGRATTRLLVSTTVIAALVSPSPAVGQLIRTADVVVTAQVIPAPPGATTDKWVRVTVTNRGPDSIDASPPRAHSVELRVSRDGLAAFEAGAGTRCEHLPLSYTYCELDPLLAPGASQTLEIGMRERDSRWAPLTGTAATYFLPAVPGVPPWLNDPNLGNNTALVSFGPTGPAGPLGPPWNANGGPCTLAKLRNHPSFDELARKSISQLRHIALRKLSRAKVDNLLACDTGRVVAKLTRLGRSGGVLATVDREFSHDSVGRISPPFKLTRRGRRLAADPPARIRARAVLRLHDTVGDVERVAVTFTMTREGRAREQFYSPGRTVR